jgi:hypothetical protein
LNFIAFLIIYTLVQFKYKELTGEQLTRLLVVLGIALRFIYVLYNPYDYRQYNVAGAEGHVAYVRYLLAHKALPADGDSLYHPPVHYLISAAAVALGQFLQFTEAESYRLLQFLMLILSAYTLIFFHKTMQELGCSRLATGVAVALFAFYPANIYLASWINNDNTLLFFYMLSFYRLVKWRNRQTFKQLIPLAFAIGLASLTKKDGLLLIPLAVLTICYEGFKKWRADKEAWQQAKSHLLYLKLTIAFLLITLPLSLSFQLRQYLLFNQSLMYVPPAPLRIIPNTWQNLFSFPAADLFRQPFPDNPVNSEGTLNDYFLFYLFQTSLFGEWSYPGLEISALLLVITALLHLMGLIIYFAVPVQGRFGNAGYVFILNIVLFMAAIFVFRLVSPFVCTQNFRYIVPVLISTAYFTGQAFAGLTRKNQWLAKFIAWPWLVLHNVFSLLFISLIGMPH